MSKCQRCHTETRVTTGSIFNTEMICMNCKSDETFHPRYKEAVEKEADEVRKGNLNFEGIGYEMSYEERIRWFIQNYYETGMEYEGLLVGMKDTNLDSFEWYGEMISIPRYR